MIFRSSECSKAAAGRRDEKSPSSGGGTAVRRSLSSAMAPCSKETMLQQQWASLTVVEHPLVQHKLSLMRDRNTSTAEFRRLLREISLLLAYEATRELPLATSEIDTPLERASFPLLAGKKLCLVSI